MLTLEHRFSHIPQDARRGRAWIASLPPLFEGRLADGAIVSTDASRRYYHLGEIVLAIEDSPAQIVERTQDLISEQALDHLVLRARTRGRVQVAGHAWAGVAAPGDLLLFDLAEPVRIATPPLTGIAVVVPRRLLAHGNGAHTDRQARMPGRVLTGSTDPLTRLVANHLIHLADVIATTTAPQVAHIVPATVALCRAIDAAQDRLRPGVVGGTEPDPGPMALAVRRYIEEHLDQVDVAVLTGQFCLSRRALYRLFAGTGGIQAYIRERRLALALRALRHSPAGRRPKLARLAHDCGFSDPRVFSRAFQRQYGLSPMQVEPGFTPTLSASSDTGLLGWLRTL